MHSHIGYLQLFDVHLLHLRSYVVARIALGLLGCNLIYLSSYFVAGVALLNCNLLDLSGYVVAGIALICYRKLTKE